MPRRVVLTKAGSPDTIAIKEMEMPSPGEGEIRIEVAFAGINFADLLMRLGLYNPRPDYPFTPGYEMSGVVDAIGEGVEGFLLGNGWLQPCQTAGNQATPLLLQTVRWFFLKKSVWKLLLQFRSPTLPHTTCCIIWAT